MERENIISYTIQTEGVNIGKPATFLRIDSNWDVDNVVAEVVKNPTHRIVITGDELLTQQKQIVEFMKKLPDHDTLHNYLFDKKNLFNWDIEIETKGMVKPALALESCQFNVSPGEDYKPEVLRYFNRLNSFFKFNVESLDDIIETEGTIMECNLDHNKIILMSESTTLVAEYAKRNGYRLLKPMQVDG